MALRPARVGDAEAIARIYSVGIEERVATFETRPATPAMLAELISGGALVVVAERDGEVVGFAKVGPYADASPYYAGVGEATLYVDGSVRRQGAGRLLLERLASEAEARGGWKLVAKIFDTNLPSLSLFRSCGWREVGVHLRHGRLDDEWKDVVVVERTLGKAGD
jgi:L-amino acid N-acyltransferase YncA